MSNDLEHLELFVKGPIVGLLLGDAIDSPVNSSNRERSTTIGKYTSFGAMCLCTMDSINDAGNPNSLDIMEKMFDHYIGGYLASAENMVEIGHTTAEALKNHSNGMPPDKCGIHDENNNDECLARMLPIALFCASDAIDCLVDKSHEICQITHPSVVSQVCCALYSIIIRNIFLQKAEKVFDFLEDYYLTKGHTEHLDALKSIKSKSIKCEIVDTFWETWTAYSSNDDFMSCMNASLSLKKNVPALVGGLSAASNGLNSIPRVWLNQLELSGEAMDVIQTFTNSVLEKLK